jgi:hypothetical protein
MKIRRTITVPLHKNRLYQFMNTVNALEQDPDKKLTPREMDILYKFYGYNSSEINPKGKQKLIKDFQFSSMTQVGTYISSLFKKRAIFRSSVRSGIYHFNSMFFPPEGSDVDEIIVRFTDGGEKEGN